MMFQYETIVDLADLKNVSFLCKRKGCGAVSIISLDSPPTKILSCGRCSQQIGGAPEFLEDFRTLQKAAKQLGAQLRMKAEAQEPKQ